MGFKRIVSGVRSLFCVLAVTGASQAGAAYYDFPGQFIAKTYTEALGRAPDAPQWQALVNYFRAAGCTGPSLKTFVRGVFLSAEYSNLGYDNWEKVLTLYRGALNRDQTPGYEYWVNYLNQGYSFASLIENIINSAEFNQNVPTYCSPGSYGWGPYWPAYLPPLGLGLPGMSASQLQPYLNAAAAPNCGTVYLAQRATITVSAGESVKIPPCVTLATYGEPGRQQYAKMARIVRYALYPLPVVEIKFPTNGYSAGRIRSVWVSGQRHLVGFFSGTSKHELDNHGRSGNIFVEGGANGVVANNKSDSSAGYSTISTWGAAEGLPCGNLSITGNLVTAYPSLHFGVTSYTDGISVACDNAIVVNNHIVDPTDLGITIFRACPNHQSSQVHSNVIVAAGNSAFGAIAIDPLYVAANPPGCGASFYGLNVYYNQFYTSPNAVVHFDIGISVGTLAWFANVQPALGAGSYVSYNSTAGVPSNMSIGIGIDGMVNATVVENALWRVPTTQWVSRCGQGNVIADVAGGHASGNLQPWQQGHLHACITH